MGDEELLHLKDERLIQFKERNRARHLRQRWFQDRMPILAVALIVLVTVVVLGIPLLVDFYLR